MRHFVLNCRRAQVEKRERGYIALDRCWLLRHVGCDRGEPDHVTSDHTSIWFVTVEAYNGDSDEFSRPKGFKVAKEVCAPTSLMARVNARAFWPELEDAEIVSIDVEPTYSPTYGASDNGARCV